MGTNRSSHGNFALAQPGSITHLVAGPELADVPSPTRKLSEQPRGYGISMVLCFLTVWISLAV